MSDEKLLEAPPTIPDGYTILLNNGNWVLKKQSFTVMEQQSDGRLVTWHRTDVHQDAILAFLHVVMRKT